MTIKWAQKAEKSWYETLQQINNDFGYRSALKFRKETTTAVKQLKKFPKSGPPEDLLASADKEYRGLLFGEYNKMIYYIAEVEAAIHIDDIWDTRREPKNQAEETIKKENF
jgi:plasmid stabilization system protein ParE